MRVPSLIISILLLVSFSSSLSADEWPNDDRLNEDTDADTIADEWEMLLFNSLDTVNATSDYDNDGYSDVAEFNNFLAKNDPLSAESVLVEAQRRIPAMIETIDIPEEMNASSSVDISWKVLGYDAGYVTTIVFFDCTDKAEGTCGSSLADNLGYQTIDTPSLVETAPWTYASETAQYFNYNYTYEVPATRADGSAWPDSGADIVVRFYQKNSSDTQAGKSSISLLIPGNVTSRYYDATGRRVVKTICPIGGCN